MCMKICEKLYITVIWTSKTIYSISEWIYVCVCVWSMGARKKVECARDKLSGLFEAAVCFMPLIQYEQALDDVCSRSNVQVFFSLSLFLWYSFCFLSFVAGKRIMSVTHWIYHPRSIPLSFLFKAVQEKKNSQKLCVCVEHRKWTRKSNWIEWIMVYSSRREHTYVKDVLPLHFFYFLQTLQTVLLCKQCI